MPNCKWEKQGHLDGRFKTTHGMYKTRTWYCWQAMKNRCKGQNKKTQKYYVDRGISYSSEWELFENFIKDMGVCPDGYELDRIDTNKSYSKENCRWATRSQQRQNSRIMSRNKAGYKGVFRSQDRKKWVAKIKLKHLGTFDTKELAAEAYNKAAIKYFGEYAHLNKTDIKNPTWFGKKHKYSCVVFHKQSKKWRLVKKNKLIKSFKTEQDAVCYKILLEKTKS